MRLVQINAIRWPQGLRECTDPESRPDGPEVPIEFSQWGIELWISGRGNMHLTVESRERSEEASEWIAGNARGMRICVFVKVR